MANTIDRRVVEMRFENQEFESKVQTTLTTLQKLKEKLSMGGAGEKFEKSGLPEAVDSVRSRFSALEVIGVTALANITNAAVNAGKRIAASFTIDQVKAGFSEYELKMGSIQTIMASTGADIQTVNGYLNELNTYADKTIYSFSDMTSSIGKFTNAGVDLDTAVKAIQGISNEAAVSGANAQEASRAMYNFAQALSAGYVKLIDWKSIENANMATKEFKQQLIDTAVEMGTLEKAADGTYKVLTEGAGGGFKETITATKNFNDSLSAAWMTTDVLTTTLGRYADETTEIGKKAFAAAQDVKTFTQLIDTVKESIGSGWATTFELIFGNLEEAKKLWTAVNTEISGFIDRTSDARNTLLQGWKDSGGRAAALEGLANAYSALKAVLGAVHDAFRDVFPPTTSDKLVSISKGFRDFTKSLIPTEKTLQNISSIFRIFFSVIKVGVNIIKGIAGAFGSLVSAILPIGGSTINILGNFTNSLESFGKTASSVGEAIGKLAGGGLSKFGHIISSVFGAIGKAIGSLNLSSLGGLLAGGGLLMLAKKLSDFVGKLSEGFDKIKDAKGIKASIKEVFGELTTTLQTFQSSLKVGSLVAIAIAVGILAASCSTLANIPIKKLASATIAIEALMGGLALASRFTSGGSAKGLVAMSIAIDILSSAVKKVGEMNAEDITKGVLAMGILMQFMIKMSNQMRAIKGGNPAGVAVSLILYAVALKMLVAPIKKIGEMKVEDIAKGVTTIAVCLQILSRSAKSFAGFKSGSLLKAAAAMLIFGVAINELIIPIKILGGMDVTSLGKGLGAVAVVLIELGAFSAVMSKVSGLGAKMIALGVAMMGMAAALVVISAAIAIMGNTENVGTGLAVMAGSLIILAAAMFAMQQALPGAAAMVVVAAALTLMAPAIALLSSLNLAGVVAGLLSLAGVIVIMGAAAAAATALWPALLPGVAILLALSVAVAGLGAGMMLLSIAFSTGITPIVEGLRSLIQMFPELATGIAAAIVAFATALQQGAPAIGAALLSLLQTLVLVIGQAIPQIVEVAIQLIVAFLTAINGRIGEITTIALQIIVNFINAVATNIGSVVDSGINLIVQFIQGMANSVAQHGPELVASIKSLVLAIIETLVSAIPVIGKKGAEWIENFRQGLDSGSGNASKSAKKVAQETEKNLKIDESKVRGDLKKTMDGQTKTIEEGAKIAAEKAKKGADDTATNLKIKDQTSNGRNAVKGIISGMDSLIPTLKSKAKEIANIVDETIRKNNEIKSPSKRLARTGRYLMLGLISGIDSLTKTYQNRADNIATTMITSTNSAMNTLDSLSGPDLSAAVVRTTEVNVRMAGMERENRMLYNQLNDLTKKLDTMTETMNSRSLNNYIDIHGSSDPSAFADELIQAFRLNARTV